MKIVKFSNGRVMEVEEPTINEWVKEMGGRFAKLIELKMINGSLIAVIRADKKWEPEEILVPVDITLTWKQYCSIKVVS